MSVSLKKLTLFQRISLAIFGKCTLTKGKGHSMKLEYIDSKEFDKFLNLK